MPNNTARDSITAAIIQSSTSNHEDSDLLQQVEKLCLEATGADLIVLPELWRIGYHNFQDYHKKAETVGGSTTRFLQEIAKRLSAHVLGGTFVEKDNGQFYNTAVLISPQGKLLSVHRKAHLLDYRSQERELLSPGQGAKVTTTELGKMGVAICYDLRFPELFALMSKKGAVILIVPAAWPISRLEAWEALCRARAVENQVYLLAADGSGLGLLGRSMIVDPHGVKIASSGHGPGVIQANLDITEAKVFRKQFPAWKERFLSDS